MPPSLGRGAWLNGLLLLEDTAVLLRVTVALVTRTARAEGFSPGWTTRTCSEVGRTLSFISFASSVTASAIRSLPAFDAFDAFDARGSGTTFLASTGNVKVGLVASAEAEAACLMALTAAGEAPPLGYFKDSPGACGQGDVGICNLGL